MTPAKSNFAADVTMRDCIRKSTHHPERRLAGTKIALRHSDAELIGETVGVFCQVDKEKHQRFAGALDPLLHDTFYH